MFVCSLWCPEPVYHTLHRYPSCRHSLWEGWDNSLQWNLCLTLYQPMTHICVMCSRKPIRIYIVANFFLLLVITAVGVLQSTLLTPGRLKTCHFARLGCRLAIFAILDKISERYQNVITTPALQLSRTLPGVQSSGRDFPKFCSDLMLP